MQNKNTLLVFVLLAVSTLCIFLALSSWRRLKNMELEFNEKKATLIRDNLDLKDRIQSLEEMVSKRSDDLVVLEKEKAELEASLKTLREENEKLSNDYKELKLTYTTLTSKKEDFSRQLEELEEKNRYLSGRITELENSPLVQRIREALPGEQNEKVKKVLADALHNVELIQQGKPVDLGPIVVTGKDNTEEEKMPNVLSTQDLPKKTAPALANSAGNTGRVISVDAKNSLLVIDLGTEDGILPGDRCVVLKDEKVVASAEIISVRYKISAAFVDDVRYKNALTDIKEGDRVFMSKE